MPEIALFGGSFDPPHVGHLLAASYVLATEPIDELWLVPVEHHPFATPLVGSYDHRIELCEHLAAQLPRTRVSRAEQESGQGRTVDLLEWLHRKHPQSPCRKSPGRSASSSTLQSRWGSSPPGGPRCSRCASTAAPARNSAPTRCSSCAALPAGRRPCSTSS